MDKEVVVHIYNGTLLSHKKDQIWVSSSEVDEPRACYTEKSKSEKQVSYTNANRLISIIFFRFYLQGRNRDADIENPLVDTAGKGEDGTNWESNIEAYILPYVK